MATATNMAPNNDKWAWEVFQTLVRYFSLCTRYNYLILLCFLSKIIILFIWDSDNSKLWKEKKEEEKTGLIHATCSGGPLSKFPAMPQKQKAFKPHIEIYKPLETSSGKWERSSTQLAADLTPGLSDGDEGRTTDDEIVHLNSYKTHAKLICIIPDGQQQWWGYWMQWSLAFFDGSCCHLPFQGKLIKIEHADKHKTSHECLHQW